MQSNNERPRDGSQSSLQRGDTQNSGQPKVLLVVGDGAEVMDTLYPFFRLGENYRVVVAAPQRRRYHLVIHELAEGWDITQERAGSTPFRIPHSDGALSVHFSLEKCHARRPGRQFGLDAKFTALDPAEAVGRGDRAFG